MWMYEFKSIIRSRKNWIYIILCFGLEIVMLNNAGTLRCEAFNERNYNIYSQYLSEYGGIINGVKIEALDTKIHEINDMFDYKDKISKAFDNKEVSFAEFEETLVKTVPYQKDIRVLNYIKNQADYVTNSKDADRIIYPNSWVNLLAGQITRYGLLLLIILVMVPVYTRDYESRMDMITSTSKNGKMRLYSSKIVALIIFAAIISIFMGVIEYIYYLVRMGFNDYLVKVHNIEVFENVVFNSSLIVIYMLKVFQWFLGLSLLIFEGFVFSVFIRNRFFTHIFLFIYTIIPVMVMSKSTRLKLLMPSGFVTDGGYIAGVDDYMDELCIYGRRELTRYSLIFIMMLIVCIIIGQRKISLKNNERFIKLKKVAAIIIMLCPLTGCSSGYNIDNVIYSPGDCLAYESMICDDYSIKMEDMNYVIDTGTATIPFNNEPIDKIYDNGSFVSKVCISDGDIYYSVDYDNDAETYFAIYKFDKETFLSECIYKSKTEEDSYLDMKDIVTVNNEVMLPNFQFVAGNLLVYTAIDSIHLYNIETREEKIIDEAGSECGLKDNWLYYIDRTSKLIRYNLTTGDKEKVMDNYISNYVFWKDMIVYVNISDGRLKSYSKENENVVDDREISVVFINNNELIWYTKDGIRNSSTDVN
ncbi:DUF5050 domain-containing protein [Falcatimonas sp. MSJ-15]|uniref:DUF5050 domain-containing protein n=1 Tax=Falcatimonas sp. MSJ-15 TaxID=2841515 RepID=UPI001C10D350|nr:DUF5050 domain-containing protein [Falcatimonas sp. MSJ-15]MBU5469946.1 DUF5050 domain-containing protein [Falcatimonas sp. MSJ-15]